MTTLTPTTITRLEMAAVDNGFDRPLPPDGDWLCFASTQAPLRIWLTALGESSFATAVSQMHVARALADLGTPLSSPLPSGAVAGSMSADIPSLYRLVRRAFQLSRSLPDELLHVFERKTLGLPKTTEAERLVVQRVGQDVFRQGLLEYWEGRCAVTGLAIADLLYASHIKPWADCVSDAERLDVFNGFLLVPHLDVAFDRGFITVDDDGVVIVSTRLDAAERRVLGLDAPLRVRSIADGHRAFLPWHRCHVFKDHAPGAAGTTETQ